jgi:hypothetical protein
VATNDGPELAMTDLEPSEQRTEDSGNDELISPSVPREPVRMSRYWMVGFPLALVAIGICGVIVALSGTNNVLGNTGVSEVPEPIEDPSAPGWTAVVEPTKTAMVAHTDTEGSLIAVSLLVGDEDETHGGSVLVVPADTAVMPPGETDALLLSTLFEEDGIEALAVGVGGLVGFGFTEGGVVLDSDAFEKLLGQFAPLEINVVDPIAAIDDAEPIAAGVHQFDGAELVAYFEVDGEGEAPLSRIDRQRQVLVALLDELRADEDSVDSLSGAPEFLGDMLAELASGTVDDLSVPVTPVIPDDEGLPVYAVSADDAERIASMSAAIVPLPISPYPGARARLELRDGAGDAIARDEAIPLLTAAGAEFVLLGNELVFDQALSEVTYYDELFAELAEDMADAIGAADPVLVNSEGPLVDVVIILGADWDG